MAYIIAEKIELLKNILANAEKMHPQILSDDSYAKAILVRPLWFWPYLLYAFEAVAPLEVNIKAYSWKVRILYFLYQTVKKGIAIWKATDVKIMTFNNAIRELVVPDAHHVREDDINDDVAIKDREGMEWPNYPQIQP